MPTPTKEQIDLLQESAARLLSERGFSEKRTFDGLSSWEAADCKVAVILSDPERVLLFVDPGPLYGELMIDVPRTQAGAGRGPDSFTLGCLCCAQVVTDCRPYDPDNEATWSAEQRQQLQELRGRIANAATVQQLEAANEEAQAYTGRTHRGLTEALMRRRHALELRAAGFSDHAVAAPF